MKFFDDLIVKIALRLLHGVMAAGTGLVYVQLTVLGLLLAGAGVYAVGALLVALKTAVIGG